MSCKGKWHKCLHPVFGEKEIVIEEISFEQAGERKKRKIRKADDVWEYVDLFKSYFPNATELEIIYYSSGSGICPVWLFGHDTIELLNMCDISEKLGYPFEGGYFDQPALFIQAMNIIGSERAKLLKMRMGEGGRKK